MNFMRSFFLVSLVFLSQLSNAETKSTVQVDCELPGYLVSPRLSLTGFSKTRGMKFARMHSEFSSNFECDHNKQQQAECLVDIDGSFVRTSKGVSTLYFNDNDPKNSIWITLTSEKIQKLVLGLIPGKTISESSHYGLGGENGVSVSCTVVK